ncbi:hypothetical protein [Haloplanus aerogenes]|uniref:Uncharacterized protein n=1 Tax=Haloplanus aerogenes TaxID=660522 RepID=A0A3M0DRJ7_9EURY|nr:hypothetical protein [Haloplanus aerogenes]AZH24188.1 hypothetical protein DU502_01820 [Haloplanus aerogenes]RMB24192.1 hypothetical protein ATH50_1432 [Haloplanus aerogenes]
MALHQLSERSVPCSVPVLVVGLAAAILLVVPAVAAGPLSLVEAYLITVAILILAVLNGAPYAAVVAVGTFPLVWTGSAGYASPEAVTGNPSTAAVAVRHVVVGFGYVVASACVGSVLVGAELAGLPLPRGVVVPAGAVVGGLLTGGAFVTLQLWRYRTLGVTLDWRTTATTTGLGVLLALSPAVTYWRFGGRLGGL